MLLAHFQNRSIPPTKNIIAKCPLCSSKVNAKCGEINIHHWAHNKNEGCDSWSEPETYWHKSWKESFPIHNREVVIEKFGKKHFADLYTKEKIVIELQNSSISSETIREREKFYGEKLLWVINGGKYREHIRIHQNEEINRILLKRNPKNLYSEIFLSNDNIDEFLNTSDEFRFSWRYPIRSWLKSKRPVFLDINENFMLWFTTGIGTDYGTFKVYPKNLFFKKYKGDYFKYQKLNNQKRLFNYKEFVKIIYDTSWGFDRELKTYNYPPYLSLKVYNNLTKKTCLHKVRWKELLIPNGNSKGLFFLFCINLKNPDIIGLYADYAENMSIRKNVLERIEKDNVNSFYHIDNNWRIDYIASIPLNKFDTEYFANSLLNFYLKNIRERIIDNNKLEIIKTTHNIG
ncbi:competence protein CoiA [Gillisia sp. CAL575]|uniref:competence protein CoiA n=1 Tax=Gillisia sp. CAL575 TaxID=985255 RepID=UPI00039FFD11|nr:competence protein CoiA family protein [Gillisia sp. CAL575]